MATSTEGGRAGSWFAGVAERPRVRQTLVVLLVLVVGYLVLWPLIELQLRALADQGAGYRAVVESGRLGSLLVTTGVLALGSLVIALAMGTALAWFTVRLPRRLRWLSVIPVLPLVVPATATVVGWTFLLSPRIGYLNVLMRRLPWWSGSTSGPVDIYTLPWIVIVTGVFLSSFVYLFLISAMRNINPELLEAAELSGSSPRQAFVRVCIPVLRPAYTYATATCLLLGLGQFVGPLLLGQNDGVDVLTTAMYRYISLAPPRFDAGAALSTPLVVFGLALVIAQRAWIGDDRRFVTQGGKSFRPLSRPSRFGAAVIGVYGLVTTALPVAALLLVAVSPFWSSRVDLSRLTTRHIEAAFQDQRLSDALVNTLTYSLISLAITLPLAFVIAGIILRGRSHRGVRAILEFLVAIPLGVPTIIFGAGVLFAYSSPPLRLYGTSWVFIVVYVTLMVPFATRLLLAGFASLGVSHVEASLVSGGGPFYTNRRVTIPMLRPAIGSAAALVFILLSQEFAASLLVRSPDTQVLSTVLFDAYANGDYSRASVVALFVGLVTAGGVVVATAIGGRGALDNL